jgi:Z1 domain
MPTVIVNGEFYPRYKSKKMDYDAATFKCAEETVEELLTHATTSDHPGMLLGKVQSGKTRTFISVLALAFDNEYDIAIILTKNSKPLVEQTRKRLEDEFSEFLGENEMEIFDIMAAPSSFTAFELESKLIFIAKKQDDNLRRLIDLFSKGCPGLAKRRTLVVDDEADATSIGYTKKEGLIEANKIAKQISDLRKVITNVSYLQVTATPYSLYLQPEHISVTNSVTFSPTRPKFTKLVPVPDAYVGGDTYFGEKATSPEPTVESLIHVNVTENELTAMKEQDGRRFNLTEVLTTDAIESFRRAMMTFVVGGCIQRINGIAKGKPQKKLRYSFLVHSEASRGSHEWQEKVVESLRDALIAEAAKDSDLFVKLVKDAYDDLAVSIQLYGSPLPSLAEVHAAVKAALAGEHLTISKVNSDEQIIAMLDSSGQLKLRSPLNVFIGGQVLDRGVTLANMIGFYYGRRPNKFQQDTVLQHSRMYGYRRDDLAVTRFYTSAYIRRAMFEMEEFDSSLRSAIEAGGDQGVQFIRQAANGRIIPCSPNKILVATTQTLRPFRRLLPIGFQSDFKVRIAATIAEIDAAVEKLCGFDAAEPTLVPLSSALALLDKIEPTLLFDKDDEVKPFDWDGAKAALKHLANQHPDPNERGKLYVWSARGRQSAREASEGSHARFIETPDSEKTEGSIARKFAINHPILFLLRQEGEKKKGWRDTPFYWPVVRAQANTPAVIYTAESLD